MCSNPIFENQKPGHLRAFRWPGGGWGWEIGLKTKIKKNRRVIY
jgi:hypothetical protein